MLAAALCAGACSSDSATRHASETAGLLRIGTLIAPNSLSPILATDTTEGMLARLVFDPLTSVDEHGRPVAILAADVPTLANGGISRDGLVITYHLRRNVHWHDGAPFTSADVRFTYNAIMSDRNNVSTRYGFDVVRAVATPDAYTVAFTLRHRFAPIVTTLFGESDNPFPILPAHLLARYPSLNNIAFNEAPIGTGPFRFVRWLRGDRLEYTANDAYFRGKPGLRRIIVRFIPDENTGIIALRTHEIDWLFEPSPQTYPQLKSLADIRTTFTQQNSSWGMLFNMTRPYVREKVVRQAITAAVDRAAIVQRFTFGTAIVASEDLPPWIWGSDPSLKPSPYDPQQARTALAGAGFRPGADGILTRDGRRLSLDLSYVQGQVTSQLVAVAVQSDLRAVGIEANIHPYVGSMLFAPAAANGILARGKYDLNLSGWYSGVDPDDSSQFLCHAVPPAGSNETRLCDPRMEAAQTVALTRYDHATRSRAYNAIERVLADDIPEDFFYYPRGIQAFTPDFHGFAPNAVVESWNAYAWSLEPKTL